MAFNIKQFLSRGPELIQAEKVFIREIPLEEIGLTLLYIFSAALWEVFSEDVVDVLMQSPKDSAGLHAMKGINFVITTGLVLYLVLRRTVRRRRLAEEASRLSQERFEYAARAATDAIWDLNLETKVVWWSEGVHNLFGYRPEDVSTKVDWWLERLHPDDRNRVVETIHRVEKSGQSAWTGHYRFRRQDGTYATVLDRGYIIRDPTGKPVRVVGGISDISERRRAEEALEGSRRQLRALAARLQSAREEERANVAREIHDELGQLLTILKINLDWMERKLGEHDKDTSLNPLLERVVESAELTDSVITNVQRIATDLRPEVLDTLGLTEALQQEAQRFQQRTAITCDLRLPPEPLHLPRDAATVVFRVFQEALTNVARHAKATLVAITLETDPDSVMLQLQDNGQGISPQAVGDSKSLGLLGMRERALVLGGEVVISPVSPRGTRVSLRLPQAANDTKFWADL